MDSDENTTIKTLRGRVHDFIESREWGKYHHPKEVALSLSVEASELLEIFQWAEKETVEEMKANPKLMERIREELADVFNYTLDMANRLDIDLTQASEEKFKKTDKKYPVSVWKGKRLKYVKL
jgi:NTP pyrophosphatase (non-canonical NTP hydrolase)